MEKKALPADKVALLEKYLGHGCTASEQAELDHWLCGNRSDTLSLLRENGRFYDRKLDGTHLCPEVIDRRIYLYDRLLELERGENERSLTGVWVSAAAVFVASLFLWLFFR